MNSVVLFMNIKILFVLTIALLSSGCEPVDTSGTNEVLWCHDGLVVSPMKVSGNSWVNGIGKETASILLAAGTMDDLSAYKTGQLINEDTRRLIKSSRTTGNGRHVIIFTGGLIAAPNKATSVCLRSE